MREPEDAASFDAFFERVWPGLQGQAYMLTGNREQAQDLTQETLVRAWRHWSKISTYDDPEAWTRRVLHNLCIQSWRRTQRRSSTGAPRATEASPPTEPITDLTRALQQLPGRQVRALLLHDGLGFSVRETADEIGVAEGTVKSWLSRSRKVLADRLRDDDDSGSNR